MDRLYSPGPFQMRECADGFLIVDRFGDSIELLGRQTGDHREEEQATNARPNTGEIDITVYPRGSSDENQCIPVKQTEEDETFTALETQIPVVLPQQAAKTIRRLALAMIEIAAGQGCCEIADLLERGFSPTEIAAHGAKAIAETGRLAPRSSVPLSLEEA